MITIEDVRTLKLGVDDMTLQQFRNALKRSIGANKDYADGCWIPFMNDPLGYLATRNPQKQSEELIRVALKNARARARTS